ncbi:MAG: hypothetical protein K6F58_07365 [Bacteroidales bacterium]|nr:hypothetical protein [Bacteroidales bacterium]
MENNGIVKWLAITLIAILGINVYRTETTKKEMTQLATIVEQLSAKLDSLEGVSPSGKANATGISKREFSSLSRALASLETKVSSLQGSVDRLSRSQSTAGTSSKAPGTTATNQSSSPSNPVSPKTSSSKGPVSVSAKVKVENRYVSGTTYLPRVSTGPAGLVVIDVTMDQIGIVTAVSFNTKSTISDEDIIDLCKESALKTHFAYNPDAPEKSKGTITYTFTAK